MNPLQSRTPFVIGVDLGQSRDHSTVAVLERTLEFGPRDPVTWKHATAKIYCVRRTRVPAGVQSLLTTSGETATRSPGRLSVPRKDLIGAGVR